MNATLRKFRPYAPRIMLYAMRAMALVLLVSALDNWGRIIGIGGEFRTFDLLTPQRQISTGYFAMVETVAAVGLWFGAVWGVAVWLFAAITEIVIHVALPDLYGPGTKTIIFHSTTILLYFVLAWICGSPEDTGELLRLPDD